MVKHTCLFLLCTLLSALSSANEPGVQVENPFYYVKKDGRTVIESDPYRDRRSKWGLRLDLGSSFYSPADDDVTRSGTSIYASFGFSRNFKLFSIGPELSIISAKFNSPVLSGVSVMMLNLGGNLYLDGLFQNPFVVPYLGFGLTTLNVDEDVINDSETQEDFSTYFKGGLLVQLNWLDKLTAAKGYYNYGLENTFLVFQFRNVSKTNEDTSLNFGSKLSFELGIQLEF